MANENTAKRTIYLPPDLIDWFDSHAKETNIKPNILIVEAMSEYMDNRTASKSKQGKAFQKKIEDIVTNMFTATGSKFK